MVEGTPPEAETILIDRENCIGCRECVDMCPQSRNTEYPVYVMGDEGFPIVANADSCIRCLSCEVLCRAGAVKVEWPGKKDDSYLRDERAWRKSRAMF